MTVALLTLGLGAAQSRIVRPQPGTTSGTASKRHVATVRSSDSSDGSRVTVSSELSLNDYEAYRRGDRFYVRIPAADVPRAESLRGYGFADVRVQRSGESTIISFRLPPGGTAHVEQHGNKLDVVFTVLGGRPAIASNTSPSRTSSGASRNKRSEENNRSEKNNNPERTSERASRNKNSEPAENNLRGRNSKAAKNSSADRGPNKSGSKTSAATNSDKSNSKTNSDNSNNSGSNQSVATKSGSTANNNSVTATASPSKATETPNASPTAKPLSTPMQKGMATPAPSATRQLNGTVAGTETPQGSGTLKERLRYWILLAQLNPVPVAIGLGILVLLITLLIFQRRRARGTRRPGTSAAKYQESSSVAAASVSKADPVPEAKIEVPVVPVVAGAALTSAAGAEKTAIEEEKPKSEAIAEPVKERPADSRRQLVARVADEVKNATSGNPYDENLIGSSDRATRQLVGAELLAALVGRNAARRDQARELFMKHGYFDDATRDLRVAESPNERAAAARRLSFIHDREATPHLIGALQDPSPDVRRAAVEALMDVRDPAAIVPLNSLMQTENDRKVPRTLIKHAIDACATNAPESPLPEVPSFESPAVSPTPLPEPDREVIEL